MTCAGNTRPDRQLQICAFASQAGQKGDESSTALKQLPSSRRKLTKPGVSERQFHGKSSSAIYTPRRLHFPSFCQKVNTMTGYPPSNTAGNQAAQPQTGTYTNTGTGAAPAQSNTAAQVQTAPACGTADGQWQSTVRL